jgi:hypothetical protein
MIIPKDQLESDVSGDNPRWRMWTRKRDIASGEFPDQGVWLNWEPTNSVFGKADYVSQEQWMKTHRTEDRDYAIRPEPLGDHTLL